ncbi:MAG: hypothetical protein HKN63_06465 [Rhodobacteraceae bacterium]|nr:hypothetical protein [Paracoccaceae bacterium]
MTYPGPYWKAPLPVWTDDAPEPLPTTRKRTPGIYRTAQGPLPATRTPTPQLIKRRWIRAQVVNARRHLGRLTAFKREDYGTGLARPKEANVQAANALLNRERAKQMKLVRALGAAAQRAEGRLDTPALSRFARLKDKVALGTRQTEAIWHFYDDLFGQRRGALADQLAAMDRIALDCYQTCYMGLGRARSLPTPPPFAFMEAASPATYRRGVVVPKLARRENPFPLVRLPFHRLMNPWSLGAVPHEIGHNLHADLKLWSVTPQLIRQRLAQAGRPAPAQATWARWHKEIYADLIGVLLIGPYYIESLLDVIAKSPARVARFRSKGVHPVSYLRPHISTELLRRIGFQRRAAAYDAGWRRIYPAGVDKALPGWLRDGFRGTAAAVVDVLCFKPMSAYGGKSLSQVVRFRPQDMTTVREAAERLASGTNPGIAPERFFICAAREALDRRLAPPEQITRNFYTALTGR